MPKSSTEICTPMARSRAKIVWARRRFAMTMSSVISRLQRRRRDAVRGQHRGHPVGQLVVDERARREVDGDAQVPAVGPPDPDLSERLGEHRRVRAGIRPPPARGEEGDRREQATRRGAPTAPGPRRSPPAGRSSIFGWKCSTSSPPRWRFRARSRSADASPLGVVGAAVGVVPDLGHFAWYIAMSALRSSVTGRRRRRGTSRCRRSTLLRSTSPRGCRAGRGRPR